MVAFNFEQSCYSCAACVDSCPGNAITFDNKLHPIIDVDKCIGCNLCEKVCIQMNLVQPVRTAWPEHGYVVKNRDEIARKNSSSGGVFIQLAKAILDGGGYVCGCVYDDTLMPRHVVANDLDTCKKMMGSKYVKSDMHGCIAAIRELTKNGKTVLFTGVPCQVAAVKRCVSSQNLLTAAVVCHGSIERDVWRRFLDEESPEGTITSVTMRDKSKGYLNYGLKFTFHDGTERITYRNADGYFLKAFTDGLLQRDRCLSCEIKGHRILSDLLLGDAWGMEKYFPAFVDDLGCSVVLALTPSGEEFLQGVLGQVAVESIESERIIENNQRIVTPAPVNPFRATFARKLAREGADLHLLTEKYAKETLMNRVKRKLARLLAKAFR